MILENPSLLILDEATSALDANTERAVCQNLQSVFVDKTVFFVTHRLATVLNADRVIVLDGGKVVENGPPRDLIHANGIFSALWRQQSG
jgi:ATP-binding cassette subfamily B protein